MSSLEQVFRCDCCQRVVAVLRGGQLDVITRHDQVYHKTTILLTTMNRLQTVTHAGVDTKG